MIGLRAGYAALIIFMVLFMAIPLKLPFGFALSVGGSMYPSHQGGDLLVLVSTKLREPEVGDVVIYYRDGIYVSHRIKAIEGDIALLQGDNNLLLDTPIPIDEILYITVARIPITVWIPAIGIYTGIYVLIAETMYRDIRKRTAYSLLAIMALMIIVAILGIVVPTEASIPVKPNPVPSIAYTIENSTLIVNIVEHAEAIESTECYLNYTLPISCFIEDGIMKVRLPGDTREVTVIFWLRAPYKVGVKYYILLPGVAS